MVKHVKKTGKKSTTRRTRTKKNLGLRVASVVIGVVAVVAVLFFGKEFFMGEMGSETKEQVVVEAGDAIVVDYIGRTVLEDGDMIEECKVAVHEYLGAKEGDKALHLDKAFEVFDTSVEAVAQACGKFHPQRDYTSGLPFTVAAGQMIPGFDAGVVGMASGDTKTILIPTADAYGERSEENVQTFPLSQLPPKPDGAAYIAGDVLYSPMGEVKVVAVEAENVKIDVNHPLAGKDLIFDITIRQVTKSGAVADVE